PLALGGAGGAFLGVTALLLFRMITAPAGSSGGTAAFQALAKVAILGGLIGTTTGVFLFFPLSELTNKAVGELCIPAGGILGVTVASFLWAVAHLLVPPPGPSSLGPTAPADDPEPTARGLPFLQPEPRKTDQVFRADRHTGADA
ncbi:MAG TPA: hypothetical protein VEL76_33825, partial [Gemmataceae bacterium]|nr:hypothetical protein [Gemmataceae bacterium]